MDEPGIASEQARLLRLAIGSAGLGLHQVWMHYFSIGGNAGEVEVEAFLHHALPLPTLERDMLAHAVNELVDHRPVTRAPYSSELIDAQDGRAEDDPPNPAEDRDR
jgi:hypothetical protein